MATVTGVQMALSTEERDAPVGIIPIVTNTLRREGTGADPALSRPAHDEDRASAVAQRSTPLIARKQQSGR